MSDRVGSVTRRAELLIGAGLVGVLVFGLWLGVQLT